MMDEIDRGTAQRRELNAKRDIVIVLGGPLLYQGTPSAKTFPVEWHFCRSKNCVYLHIRSQCRGNETEELFEGNSRPSKLGLNLVVHDGKHLLANLSLLKRLPAK